MIIRAAAGQLQPWVKQPHRLPRARRHCDSGSNANANSGGSEQRRKALVSLQAVCRRAAERIPCCASNPWYALPGPGAQAAALAHR